MGASVEVNVTYVEPSGASADGVRTLGHFVMSVPPRKGETVVLCPTFRADAARYEVKEVIHHMPIAGVANAVLSVTVLVIPVLTEGDLQRVMTTLCSPAHLAKLASERADTA